MVLLVGLGLLGVRRHHNGAVEVNPGTAAGNAVDFLGGMAARGTVVHEDADVHLLCHAS